MKKTTLLVGIAALLLATTASASHYNPCRICDFTNYCLENCMSEGSEDTIINLVDYKPSINQFVTNSGGGGISTRTLGRLMFGYENETFFQDKNTFIDYLMQELDKRDAKLEIQDQRISDLEEQNRKFQRRLWNLEHQ